MKQPNHFKTMSAETLAKLQTGFYRFRFGFAKPGEKLAQGNSEYTFIGNFIVKKQAQEIAERHPDYMQPGAKGVAVHPYLNGRHARGWAVYAWDHHN